MEDHFPEGYVIEKEIDVITNIERNRGTVLKVFGTKNDFGRTERHIHYRRASDLQHAGNGVSSNEATVE